MRKLTLALIATCTSSAIAQTGAYYITEGTAGPGSTHVMQSGAQMFSYAWAANAQMPIVIGDFGSGVRVRQAAGQPTTGAPQQGDEYLLNGTPTGFTNFWDSGDPAGTTAYDAAFDGTSIYMVHWLGATDGEVFRYDSNYGNGQFLFAAETGDLGITYDSAMGTVWTCNFSSGSVKQYSLAGAVLSQFNVGQGAASLAYDASDDTFWMYLVGNGQLAQYNRSGGLLQSYSAPGFVLGGEFAAVPEPATVLGVFTGLSALLLRARRRA